FNYTTNNGAITITGYTGSGGDVTIPSTINGLAVVGIGVSAFQDFWNVTSVTISDSVTNIGAYAFEGCSSLNRVTIGSGDISIGYGAFAGCNSLNELSIPDGVASIGRNALAGCTSLTNISVDTRNGTYSSRSGVLLDKSQTTLIQYPAGNTSAFYSIPGSVTGIADGAFASCQRLTSVIIPNSVTSIGNYAFEYCTNLIALYFQGNAPSVL